LNLPFRLQAIKSGLVHLGDLVDILGPYLSTAGFVMRVWAQQNEAALVAYIKAYVRGLRWVLKAANHTAVVDLLQTQLKLERDVATSAVEMATSPRGGLMVDANIDLEGFANVLSIRAAFEKKAIPQRVQRYIDTRYHALAMQQIDH
jgi:ABC-type nitrate/sulfonate/bicarbonate transport system substrate-binding protein